MQKPGRSFCMADDANTGLNSNSDQLRGDIDSGRTGDKAAAVDPAAAPLGTDSEAGGKEPSGAAVAAARKGERAGDASGAGANASSAEITPSGMGMPSHWIAPAAIGVALGALFTVVLALTP